MEQLLQNIFKLVKENWFDKVGLYLGILLVFTVSCFISKILEFEFIGNSIFVFICLSVFIFLWFDSNKIPKVKKNKFGFIIAIHVSNESERRLIAEDFISPLRSLVSRGESGEHIQIIELKEHISRQIHNASDAEKIRRKTKGHFILYGNIKNRKIDGENKYVIELEGEVAHAEIDKHLSDNLAREFAKFLPRRFHISSENNFHGFKFTSEWADVVCKYIISIATLYSGDDEYAEIILKDVRQSLSVKDSSFPIYQLLNNRIKNLFNEIYLRRSHVALNKWHDYHEDLFIDIIEFNANMCNINNLSKNHIYYNKSIVSFLKYRDVVGAKSILNKISKRDRGAQWYCNMAFLCGYEGKLAMCKNHYKKAMMPGLNSKNMNDVENFINYVAKTDVDRPQVWFVLGYFNQEFRGDFDSAKQQFRQFLERSSVNEYPIERSLAETYIAKIE